MSADKRWSTFATVLRSRARMRRMTLAMTKLGDVLGITF
jgi:hypothetical protein